LLVRKMKEATADPDHQIDMVRMYNYTTFGMFPGPFRVSLQRCSVVFICKLC
jgi:hypothetical protein